MNKNKNCWRKIDSYAKKYKAIELLGGKCEYCGETNFFKLEFHHLESEEKEYNISHIRNYRWSIIESEIKKCKLLCRNCHNEEHNTNKNKRRYINKKTFLEYKKIFECEKCGYNKYNGSLDFHHIDPKIKDLTLSQVSLKYNNILELSENIENELNKCIVLCKNCHTLEHSDINFFEKNKDIIIEKSNKLKEVQSKIDRNLVKLLYDNGMKQIDIAKKLNASKGTISDIIKNDKNIINKEKRINKDDVIFLYKSGMKQIDIANKLNASKSIICEIIKKNKLI
jgi:predicted XRE-type DNA-binding protein